ncbi:alpha/beta hydrolase family protein [Achromobacter sp. UBA2119]|uniref:alpha/beta hydrolase family protein n=1 Tax=Achromobacter sp. UBA2119 TaxID=1945911 RepID=UPI002580753D|nr:alpha/beta fold hydrolase [Achromobacter sp. UBA2119]
MFQFFDENYTWNMAVNLALGMGAAIGEIDDASFLAKEASLRQDPQAAEILFASWTGLGDRLTLLAHQDLQRGRQLSAGEKFRRAAIYYVQAERMQSPNFADRSTAYSKMLTCFRQYVETTNQPVEFVNVPYQGGILPALFVPAVGHDEGLAPCMVHFDGLDVTKEILYLLGMGDALRNRGVSVLLVDNPGVGEALRFHGLTNFPESEIPAAACVDYLECRDDVDTGRIGIMALSLGGFHAPRAAAFEPRLRCCVAWGANYDWGATQRYRYESRDQRLPVPHYWDHVMWVFGEKDIDSMLTTADRMSLEGILDRIRCPILVTHGENDRQIRLEQAERLIRECVNSPKAELFVHTLKDGGAEHCSVDNIKLGVDTIADWVSETMNELEDGTVIRTET